MRKHQTILANATKAYSKDTSSSVLFLIDKNDRMAKELQMSKQGGELVTESTLVKLKKEILDELLSINTVMQEFYFKFGTWHKEIIHLNGWQ